MQILQLVGSLGNIGGIESYVKRLSDFLAAQGHDTLVLVLDNLSDTPNNLPDTPIPYRVITIPDLVGSSRSAAYAQAEVRLLNIAGEFQPDVVLTHHTALARLLTKLNACFSTVELIHTVLCGGSKLFRRGDRICTHPVGWRCLFDWYAGPCGSHASPAVAIRSHLRTVNHIRVLKQLTGVIVGSEFMKQYLLQEGLSPERVFVADLTTGIAPQKRVPRASQHGKNILYVGRLVYNKGVQYVIKAMAFLDETYRLTVVGDGYYLQDLKQLAVRLNVQDRVEFTGFLQGEALETRYRIATVVVFPTILPEPTGLVIPEARSRGLPVVAFDVGGIREWVTRYGYNAIYLVDRVDASLLAQAISRATAGEVCSAECRPVSRPPSVVQVLQYLVGRGEMG